MFVSRRDVPEPYESRRNFYVRLYPSFALQRTGEHSDTVFRTTILENFRGLRKFSDASFLSS
jgi:hypothetical protein